MKGTIEHYEIGMMEGEYLASETDELCAGCGTPLRGFEVEDGRRECQRCDPPAMPKREPDYSENPF